MAQSIDMEIQNKVPKCERSSTGGHQSELQFEFGSRDRAHCTLGLRRQSTVHFFIMYGLFMAPIVVCGQKYIIP